MSEWISVKERLPERTGSYLAVLRGFYRMRCEIVYFALDAVDTDDSRFIGIDKPGWYQEDCDGSYYNLENVVYWMEIPELPEWR